VSEGASEDLEDSGEDVSSFATGFPSVGVRVSASVDAVAVVVTVEEASFSFSVYVMVGDSRMDG
jgi:hypothetical protein